MRKTHLQMIAVLLVCLLCLSFVLIAYEETDGFTTLTGKSHSWTTHPYQAVGWILLVVSVISLIIVGLAYFYQNT